ncbi:MAG: CBS domain-containing protein, partial [Campylobacteraceae bacterium]|nr:CBS domain-containing protein [Campylobacteraceae bacterium]
MSLKDQEAFLRSIHPFELLTASQLHKATHLMGIACYPKDTLLVSPKITPEYLFIIIKGEVGEYFENELIKVYHSPNSFDADVLLYGKSESTFKVHEELLCFEVKKEDFKTLLDANEAFRAYFLTNIACRIQSAKHKEYSTQLSGFMIAKISDTYIHQACIVSPQTPIIDALKQMDNLNTNCIIVDDEEAGSYGIVTDSVIRKHVLYLGYDKYGPIGPIALRPIISIDIDDFLFNALLQLTKNSIKRIVITKQGKIIGILEQLDLLSYFANHTYLVSVQVRKAKSVEELKRASQDFVNIIKKLHIKGTRVEYISQLISELNEQIYRKLYTMMIPLELQERACLVVMGSEGRKEQMLKTDQDNALIIEDGADAELFALLMEQYTDTLIGFGYPECEGGVMVSNPYWRKSFSAFKKEIGRYLESPRKDDYMQLAIFYDAIAVAGNKNLLLKLKQFIHNRIEGKNIFMANFAKAALLFETPISFFSNLKTEKNRLDIKKGGIFPIVQGVRSLALEYRIDETETIRRLQALKEKNIFEDGFA